MLPILTGAKENTFSCWTATLSYSTFLYQNTSWKAQEKCVKSSFPRKHTASISLICWATCFCTNILGCLFKKIKWDLPCTLNIFVWTSPHLCWGHKTCLRCMNELVAFVQSVWGENRSRGVYELNKRVLSWFDTSLWCLSVVSTTRVRLRYRKCFVTSVVCASRQPLHWAAPSAGAQWH